MTVFLLLTALWCCPPVRWCARNFTTWLLLPKTAKEVESRGEIFAGWFIPASIALAITWMVWYASGAAEPAGCSHSNIHNCFPPDLVRDLFIHGGIAAGVGGSLHLIMLRDALNRARAAEARADREQERADKERALRDEERERTDRERERADKEREKVVQLQEELMKVRESNRRPQS